MIDKNDFIIKNNRRYFKAKCDLCGGDRGYKTPDHDKRPCPTCNTKKANVFSQISRKKKSKRVCSIEGCGQPHHGKSLCEEHYSLYIRKEVTLSITREKKVKKCFRCNKEFECKSLKAKFCSKKCKSATNNDNHPLEAARCRKRWQQNNKEKLKEYRLNPTVKIAANLRSRVSRAVKNNFKGGSAVDDLGCSIAKLKIHLQLKFHRNPRGKHEYMTWDNYGEWHMDHIKPLNIFDLTNPEQFKIACHYTNLQPLWAKDNLKKSDNV